MKNIIKALNKDKNVCADIMANHFDSWKGVDGQITHLGCFLPIDQNITVRELRSKGSKDSIETKTLDIFCDHHVNIL